MVTDVDEKLAFFKENGYWVEHGLLTPPEGHHTGMTLMFHGFTSASAA